MRLLLDTHVFLWWRMGGGKLGPATRDLISNADQVFVSAASAWECAIKEGLGKLKLPAPFSLGVTDSGFDGLPIQLEHGEKTKMLPFHHRDPFDRMLLAQAICEELTLVTADKQLTVYGGNQHWAFG